MPPQLTARLKKAGTAIGGMTLGQKVIAVLGVAVLVLGGTAFAKWATKPDYAPLYTGLSAQDADSVTKQLTKDGVDYQLADNGSTVLVPAQDVDAEKLSVAGAGIVTQNTSGYALLDGKSSITSSEFQQQVTYQRAMEGELANTIQGIDGVDTAVVHLAIPQQTVFTDKAGTPTASVLVGMKDGKTLTDDQVQSIVNLVSSSVPDMKSDEVTVTDSSGTMLAQAGKGVTGGTSSTDAQTTSYDTTTAAAVQAMLDKVLGSGKSLAHVNATLDFDTTQKTSQTYSYTKGVPPISQSVQKEAVGSGSSDTVGGALGSNGVLGMDGEEVGSDSASASASASPSPYISENVTQDNAVNSQTEKTTVQPGQVSRQSVAVVVDSAAAAKVGVRQLTQMVSAAAGIDTSRGDTLSVTRQPFDTSAATSAAKQLAAAKAAQAKAAQLSLLKQGVVGLGVLLLALALFIAWRRASKKRRASSVDLGELERLYNPSGPVIGPDGEPLGLAGAPTEPVGPQLTPAPADPAALRRAEVGELVDSQPAEVAELLRGWLTETRK